MGDFKVTTPKNPLLSKQVVTSKRILVPYTNLQLNLYPNTQLDLFCCNNLSFQCMASSTWLTNKCADPSTRLDYQLKKDVGCKVLQFITWWSTRNSLVINPTVYKHNSFFKKKNELEQILSLVTICMNKTLLHTRATCVTFDGPQNNPYISLGLWEKKSLNTHS